MSGLRLPGLSDHTCVLGQNGSGKTVFSAWLLSEAPFDVQPYVIIDYKRDDLLGSIDYAEEIDIKDKPPKHSGLYIVRPKPTAEKEVEDFLWKCYERERIGLFFDETTMLPGHYRSGAVKALFVQGRSKRIPIIACSQRPSGVNPQLFSEARYFAIFYLLKLNDLERAYEPTPWSAKWVHNNPLPRHHCHWYDVPQRFAASLTPCPDEDKILARFRERLKPRRRIL